MKKIQKQTPKRKGSPKLNYNNARKQLAEDFNNRCGYCDDSAQIACCSFHIDHFAPRKFEHLVNDYNNFVYSCPYCNMSKKDKWVSDSADISVIGDVGFVDPCDDSYNELFERLDNGKIKPLTKLAEYIYLELKLYLKRHEVLYLMEEINTKCDLVKLKIRELQSGGKNTEKLEKIHYELLKYFKDYFSIYQQEWNSGQ